MIKKMGLGKVLLNNLKMNFTEIKFIELFNNYETASWKTLIWCLRVLTFWLLAKTVINKWKHFFEEGLSHPIGPT